MHEPILKLHWERLTTHVDIDNEIAKKLLLLFTQDAIAEVRLLSEGCANTNYKVSFLTSRPPVMLRIYVRERSALEREIALHNLVLGTVPVPRFLFSDERCAIFPHPYAIIEWIDGILMRELILRGNEQAIAECAFEAGLYLSKLRAIRFAKGGFFQDKLKVRPFTPDERYEPFVRSMLEDKAVKTSLGAKLHQAAQQFFADNLDLIPQEDNANLTHGDYDPANMLVKEVNGHWHIAAILDWEFSFAGTYLLDIGLMLRYSHKLPNCYEKNFILGIESTGEALPSSWKKKAKLMDLMCLLQLAHYNPPNQRPNLNRDVVALIKNTLENWYSF